MNDDVTKADAVVCGMFFRYAAADVDEQQVVGLLFDEKLRRQHGSRDVRTCSAARGNDFDVRAVAFAGSRPW